jgi:N-acetylglucosaminyl-diphospho-decaprenol L-rhamnosyltransferase
MIDYSDTPCEITVVVLNYNAGAYLAACIDALAAQSLKNFRAIIADNGSSDKSFTDARSKASDPRFEFVEFGENHGFARGNNLALQGVETPLMALLNPDAFPAPDWLARLDAAQRTYRDADSFGSLQLDLNEPTRLDGAGDNYLALGIPWRGGHGHAATTAVTRQEGKVFSACAAAALYRTEAFKAAGGFDEDFFCYVEDVDLGFRLRLFGGACMQISGAIVRHAGGVSSGSKRSEFAIYHGMRNMVWTFMKNMPGALFWPLLPAHVAVLVMLLVKAMMRGEGAIVARGFRDALCGLPMVWAKRKKIQAQRRASVAEVAAALVWDFRAYLKRNIVCKDILPQNDA